MARVKIRKGSAPKSSNLVPVHQMLVFQDRNDQFQAKVYLDIDSNEFLSVEVMYTPNGFRGSPRKISFDSGDDFCAIMNFCADLEMYAEDRLVPYAELGEVTDA